MSRVHVYCITQMSQSSEEDIEEQIKDCNENYLPEIEEEEAREAGAAAAAADKGKAKEIVECDADEGDVKERKDIAKRSDIWDHFTEVKDEQNVVIKGKCKYCKHDIQAHSVFNGTSAMRKHFNNCKHNPHRGHLKQGVLQLKDGSNVETWKFDPESLRAAFSEMIIEDELPFAFGEKSGFRKFMALACPRFNLPSRRTCTRDTVKLFFEQKAKLIFFFPRTLQKS